MAIEPTAEDMAWARDYLARNPAAQHPAIIAARLTVVVTYYAAGKIGGVDSTDWGSAREWRLALALIAADKEVTTRMLAELEARIAEQAGKAAS